MEQDICSGGFLVKKDTFLFGKRSKKKLWAPGVWDIVGGHALKHENPFYTLKRETEEETGIVVLDAELMTSMDVFDKSENNFFKYHIYMITQWRGKPHNCSEEHIKLRWFKRAELNDVLIALPEYLTLIDNWMNAKKL